MQPPNIPPRDALSVDTVLGLIRGAAAVEIGRGCELIGLDLVLIEDISPDFEGGTVSRGSYDTLHGTATLKIARELPYASAIVRPYMTISDGVNTARFNVGAYYTNTPARVLPDKPITYTVQCYDVLSVLADNVGDGYRVSAGANYLTAIEDVLQARGVTQYIIDQAAMAKTLPVDKVWMFDDKTTWLAIVNDLLNAIGYAGIWSDWDGRLICAPYVTPSLRAPEWVYDVGPLTSMIAAERTSHRDFTNAPNRWVGFRENNIGGPPPVEGDGRLTVVNELSGDTSVASRKRTITKRVPLDVADHDSLVVALQRVIDADTQIPIKVGISTFPNPLHWHFDVVQLEDPDLGPTANVLATRWTLNLDGSDMTHEWTVIA